MGNETDGKTGVNFREEGMFCEIQISMNNLETSMDTMTGAENIREEELERGEMNNTTLPCLPLSHQQQPLLSQDQVDQVSPTHQASY